MRNVRKIVNFYKQYYQYTGIIIKASVKHLLTKAFPVSNNFEITKVLSKGIQLQYCYT